MKKLFFFAAFLCAASLTTVNAQCTKSAKTAGTKTACCAKTKAATAKAVSADASIEKRVCEKSGAVSYFRNKECAVSGKITSTEVEFDAKTSTFVNVSPSRGDMPAAETVGAKKACSAADKAACSKKCTKGAKSAKAGVSTDTKAEAKFTKSVKDN